MLVFGMKKFCLARSEELTEGQWAILKPPIPSTVRRTDGRRKLQVHRDRAVRNDIYRYYVPALHGRICQTASC